MGISPSHDLFEDHGSWESSAESAMQPPSRSPARTASANLVGDNDIVFLEIVLRPVGEDVADDPVLADDFLSQADASDDFAGGTIEAGTRYDELKQRERSHEVVALKLLHGFGRDFDDREDGIVVDLDDLALVAGGDGRDGAADFTGVVSGYRRLAVDALLEILNHLLKLFNHLFFFGKLFLGRFGLFLGGGYFVLEGNDIALESLDFRLALDELALELGLLTRKVLNGHVAGDDRGVGVADLRLETVYLFNEVFDDKAQGGERITSFVEAFSLGLACVYDRSEESVGLGAVGDFPGRLAVDIDGAKLLVVGARIPRLRLVIVLLEIVRPVFGTSENVLHLNFVLRALGGSALGGYVFVGPLGISRGRVLFVRLGIGILVIGGPLRGGLVFAAVLDVDDDFADVLPQQVVAVGKFFFILIYFVCVVKRNTCKDEE